MATSASLAALLTTKSDITFYTQQLTMWSNKYESTTAKVQVQTKAYEKWESAYDKVMDAEEGKEVTRNGVTYQQTEADATKYAYIISDEYDEETSLELVDEQMEYDTMKTMYETLLEELRAKEESEKSLVSTNAQDTHLLNAG